MINEKESGKFIAMEGLDGCGKSTHIPWMKKYIEDNFNSKVITTREPGGTGVEVSEKIREILLNYEMSPVAQIALFAASRIEHIEKLIKPELELCNTVITDRFIYSNYAYQGAGYGDLTLLNKVNIINSACGCNETRPDVVFLFDIPAEVAAARVSNRSDSTNVKLDTFEKKDFTFFNNVRNQYLEIAKYIPKMFCVLDGTKTIDELKIKIADRLDKLYIQ